MHTDVSRRGFMSAATAACGMLSASGVRAAAPAPVATGSTFRYALNAATLRGYKLSLSEQIVLTAQAGYTGIEPWVDDIAKAAAGGTPLSTLKRQCADAGLSVVSAISFAAWAVDDDTARAKGMEQMKRDMDLVAQIGGTHIAASPAGVYGANVKLDLDRAAERYRAVLELGRSMSVIPQIEFWGSSANLSRLDQCIYVAARAAHPDACVLADAYHMYRGGSEAASLRLLSRSATHCFHMNDYPASRHAKPSRIVIASGRETALLRSRRYSRYSGRTTRPSGSRSSFSTPPTGSSPRPRPRALALQRCRPWSPRSMPLQR